MEEPREPRELASQSTPKKKVLFICVGNACRSPMAEAVAQRDAADVVDPSSAGLFPLGFLPELTIQTLIENGCSTDFLTSKPVTTDLWDSADLVINMSGTPRHLAFDDFGKVEDWDVQDPYGAGARVYQTIFEEIAARVHQLADRLRKT